MKAAVAALVLGLLLGSPWAEAQTLPAPGQPADTARWLEDLGPRREGSDAENRVFGALRTWFQGRAAWHESDFRNLDTEHSFSRQAWFRVPGRARGELVVVVPTDGPNHRGLAWAAAWADEALRSPPAVALTFLFTGAERGSSAGLGSRTFLDQFYPEDPAAALYLDTAPFEGPRSEVRLVTESRNLPSPLWMTQGVSEALEASGLAPRLAGATPSLFRLDLPERRTALDPWLQRGIPALGLAAGPAQLEVPRALEAFAASLEGGVPGIWDRHWLAFGAGPILFFWGQGTYLVILLGGCGLVLAVYAALGRRRRGSVRILGPGWWQLPLLWAVGSLALRVSQEAARALGTLRGLDDLWKAQPLATGAFEALLAITLYLTVQLPFRRNPLARDPDFYAQGALVILGAMTLASAGMELSFSFYFFWALVWAAAFTALPGRWTKALALAAGPAWLFKAAWDILGPAPDLSLASGVLVPSWSSSFSLALLFLPFLLQIQAWHFTGLPRRERHEGVRAALQMVLWTLLTAAAALYLVRVPVEAVATAPARPPGAWTHEVQATAFLGRQVWRASLEGPGPVEGLTLVLESTDDRPLTVYDSTFPVVLSPEGRTARLVVGRQPPLPLNLRLTLPASARAVLTVSVQTDPGAPAVEADRWEIGP